jgi:tetratricopeptide (TPR) repeat protein
MADRACAQALGGLAGFLWWAALLLIGKDQGMNYGRLAVLGVALAFGAAVTMVPAQPVAAKDKPAKPVKETPPKFSPAFGKEIGALQTAINAKQVDVAKAKLASLEPLASTPDDKFYLGQFRQLLGGQMQVRAMQVAGLKEMLASGSTRLTPENSASFKRYLGIWAYQAKDYSTALTFLTEAEAGGVKDGELYIFLADSQFRAKQYQASFASADKAVALGDGKGGKADESWYIITRQHAYQTNQVAEMSDWARKLAKAYPTSDNLHDMVAYYINAAKPGDRDRLDTFRLMREMKVMKAGSEYNELADLLLRLRYPGEAKAALDEGYKSGIISQGSQQAKDLTATAGGQVNTDRASLAGSEKTAQARPTGGVAMNVADAYLGYGDNAKALSFYEMAKSKGGVDLNELNTHVGIALLRSGRKAEAIQAFSSVGGTRTELGKFWKTWAEMQP